MSALRPLTEIKRLPLQTLLAGIDSTDHHTSAQAGLRLCSDAKAFGLNLRDYLTLATDVRLSFDEINNQKINRFQIAEGQFMTGYEAALMHLNLPVKADFNNGILLEAASDSFNFKPGTRVLFPEVVDDMMRWQNRMDQFETTEGMVAQSRTIRGVELVTKAIMLDDNEARSTGIIAEFGNIPVYSLSSTENAVKFYKFGSAMRTSYEFERRVTMDVLTPYAARIERQLELGKVKALSALLINGDNNYGAAPIANLSSYGADYTGGKTLKDNYVALMKFLVNRAKAGVPVDTLVGNLDQYLELFLMFLPVQGNKSLSEHLQDHGGPRIALSLPLMTNVTFRLSSDVPANTLICYSRADTVEELIEASSDIRESEQAVKNQSITYVRTQNAGYKLIFGDTRTVLRTAS